MLKVFVFNDRQNAMIMDRFNSNALLAERFGCNVRSIQRQRAYLKSLCEARPEV